MTRDPTETNDEALRDRLRMDAPRVDDAALDTLFADIESEVERADARPLAGLRARPTRVRRSIASVSFVAIFCLAVFTGTRDDLAFYPIGRLIAECAAYAALLVISIFTAVRSEAAPLLTRARVGILVGVSVLAAAVLAMMPAPHTLPIHLVGHGPTAFFGAGSPCMYIGLAAGLPVYLALRLVDRGSPLASVLAASAAGLLSNLVLQVHCSVTSVGHRLVGHASIGPILLVSIGVALLFERALVSRRGR